MNKEELLKMIKDEVAIDHGYLGIDHLIELSSDKYILKALDEISNRYAIAMCEEQKKACAEEADVEYRGSCFGDYIVDKQSILNTKNVAE